MNASCWGVFQDKLYFGGNTAVYLADSGVSDDGNNIEADAKQAFNYFRPRSREKDFKMVRPVFSSDGVVNPGLQLNVDFEEDSPVSVPTSVGVPGAVWDEELWDVAEWGGSDNISKNWAGITGTGYSAAMRMKVNTKTLTISWKSTDFLYEVGGHL